ncbi:GAF domain-containing protein [candidate division KSB1 bacterium]|nr:GAF domain-containing protein [candidate division KSB1 bacterium]
MSSRGRKKSENKITPHASFQYVEILNAVSLTLHQSLQPDEICRTAVDQLHSYLESSAIALHLISKDDTSIYLHSQKDIPANFYPNPSQDLDEGVAGTIVKTGSPVFICNRSELNDKHFKQIKRFPFEAYAGIPITGTRGVLGVIELFFKRSQAFLDETRQLCSELGSLIGLSIQNGQMYKAASDRAQRYMAISRAIAVTRQLGTLDQVLFDITKVLVQSFGFDQAWIGLINGAGTEVVGEVGFGPDMKTKLIQVAFPLDSESSVPPVTAIQNQEAVVCQEKTVNEDAAFQSWMKSLKTFAYGFFPILSEDRAIGVMGVFSRTPHHCSEEDQKALGSVSEQAAIAIENAYLYDQVKASGERYRTLFRATGSGLVILDRNLTFKLVNPAFEELSGRSSKELVGKLTLPSFFSAKLKSPKEQAQKLREPPQSIEAEFVCRKGELKQVYLTTAGMPDSKDILVSIIDMTRERELERRLFKSEELASIGELSAGIAHEIRNPLVSIKNSVSLLKDETQLTDEGQQLLEVVREESNHLAAIVEDFLQFARPKKPNFQKEDVNYLMSESIKRCLDVNGKKVGWIESYSKSLPEVSLDRYQIHQVVHNLLLNGMDAIGDKGSIEIKTSSNKTKDGETIQISIQDTGLGIPVKNLPKIFQPFFSTKEKGTGMGLAICSRIIEEHKGDISVESEEGFGTTFTIKLPVDSEN